MVLCYRSRCGAVAVAVAVAPRNTLSMWYSPEEGDDKVGTISKNHGDAADESDNKNRCS